MGSQAESARCGGVCGVCLARRVTASSNGRADGLSPQTQSGAETLASFCLVWGRAHQAPRSTTLCPWAPFVGPITPQQSRQPQHSFDVLDKQASHFHGNRSCLRATKTLRATDRHKPANQAKSRLPPLVSPATAYPEARCPVAARKQDGISSNSIRFLETAGKIGRHKRPLSTDRLLERKGEEEDHEDCNQLGRPALVPVAWPACFGRVA